MADKNFKVKNGLDVGDNISIDATTNTITVDQGTNIEYSENNDRANRINVKSTTGNTSGFRVMAPNDTTSAISTLSVFSTDDQDNGKFINIQARGSATDPLRIVTGEYVSGVQQTAGTGVSFYDYTTEYASINPSGPTNSTDLTTKSYVDTVVAGKDNTDEITEGTTNLYFTQARARQSISVTDSGGDGSLAYDNSTGVITYTGPSAAEVRAHFSAGTGISITDGSVAVDFTEFDTDEITEGTTNKYYTDARARQSISVTDSGGDGSLSYDNSTGVITYTGPSATEVRAHLSVTDAGGDGSLAYDNSTGVFTYTGPSASEVRAHFSGGTGVTITDGVVAIGQSVGTGDSPTFAGVSAGNISVGVASDNTITSTNTNGNLVLAANGTGDIVLSNITRLQGEMQASTNLNYTFPAQTLNTVTDNNGYSAASSMPAGTNGYGANAGYTHYYGDTLAGNNTAAAVQMRSAAGNSTTDTVPFTGIAGVAPSAVSSTNVLGTFNFNGYGTTAFSNDIGTQYQGGGINAMHSVQFQGVAAENFSDSTLTVGSANITAVASSFRSALGAPSVTGTKGQISFNSTTPSVGNAIRVTGTLTGTATGIVSGQNYYIIATNGSTTATLSATPGGSPIDTTAGTLTGLTLTRCGVTFTLSGQTSVPFGRGALVTVSGVNNVTDGTYPVFGTPTTTSVALGIPHTVAPTLSGTQSFSCPTGYMAGGYRVRTFPLATPANFQNRLELVNHTAASFAVRADAVSFNAGGYGTSGVGITGDKISYNRVTGQWYNTATITPAAANTAYAFAPGTSDTAITNIASVGSTSRIIPGAAGKYNLQFSVQWDNADTQEHAFYVWLRKNGTDVADSAGKIVALKQANGVNSWNYLLSSANTTDYWELMYSVDNTAITFPYVAASSPVPGIPSIITTLVPVGA